ncbi:MAG: hypothetical protein JXR32_06565 [Anaerolineaceae bacterium]|nr:hypothetical protein [Anaerolineaceae bacterium]
MSDQKRYEKEEKEEKEVEKHEEKTMEEKWQRDPLGSMIWALILIWAGLVWLGWNLGIIARYSFLNQFLTSANHLRPPFIALIFLGAGILILLEIVIRLLVPTYRRSVIGSIILAAIFIGIGLGDIVTWNVLWPVVIIAVGLIFLLQGIIRRK